MVRYLSTQLSTGWISCSYHNVNVEPVSSSLLITVAAAAIVALVVVAVVFVVLVVVPSSNFPVPSPPLRAA